nr:hypothetical protein [Nesterenkonia sp. Act20]
MIHSENARAARCLQQPEGWFNFGDRVAIVVLMRLVSPPEQDVGLIEEDQSAATFGFLKYRRDTFLGLVDVAAEQRTEVDPEQLETEFSGQLMPRSKPLLIFSHHKCDNPRARGREPMSATAVERLGT